MNLLGRARKMLQDLGPTEPPKPQSYNVSCAQGHRLRGLRTEGYQALRCPSCGDAIFVLPRSPLPDPPAPASSSHRPRPASLSEPLLEEGPIPLTDPVPPPPDDAIDGEIEWMDSEPVAAAEAPRPPVAAPPPEGRAPNRPRDRREPKAAPSPARPSHRPPEPRRAQPAVAAPRPPASKPAPKRPGFRERLRQRRPLLVFLVVLIVVAGTIALAWRKQRWRDLPKDAEIGRIQGLEALDAGEFDEAKRLLARAARAVDLLGGEYEGAEAIRQGSREAAIYADLVSEPLETILQEAVRAGDEEWPRLFAARYQGGAILLEAHVTAVPDAAGAGLYDLDYRILTPGPTGRPRVARIDLAHFALFDQIKPRRGERVLFGGRLAALGFEDGQWWVRLEPASGVLLTRPRPLEALGWPSSESGRDDR